MAKIYDFTSKITNELPVIKVTDDIVCTINNRKNNILLMQAMLKEREEKQTDGAEDELQSMKAALNLIIGEKNTEAIEALNLPINEYTELFKAVMKIAQGEDPEAGDTPTE